MTHPADPWGICARSGRRLRRIDMVPDGRYPNLLVDPRWREEKHPQETPARTTEDITVRRPAPDVYTTSETATFPYTDLATGIEYAGVVIMIDTAGGEARLQQEFYFVPQTFQPAYVLPAGSVAIRFAVT